MDCPSASALFVDAQLLHPEDQVFEAMLAGLSQVTSRPAAAERLSDLAWLRRVRDRIDREYARSRWTSRRAEG